MIETTTFARASHAAASAGLETGHADTTPIGDTVHRRFMVHLAACMTSVAEAAGGRVLRRPWGVATDLGRPSGLYNSAVLSRPLWEAPDAVGECEAFYAHGTGEVLLWSPWPTPDLAARGWHLVGHPPMLWRTAGGALPGRAADVTVAEVTDAPALDAAGRVIVEGYPLTGLLPYRSGALLPPGLLDDPRWRLWVARRHGRPVSAAALFVDHGIAQLALAATLPAARGRGAWYALVRERLLAAPGLPSAGIFSDHSRPGVERLGYLPIVRFTLWSRPRPDRPRPPHASPTGAR
jgi:hypothetical protein